MKGTMSGFEDDLKEAMGDRIQEDDIAMEVWSALANVCWYHPQTGQQYSCTFRYAGSLIAELRASGDYMDWYCSSPAGVVSDFVRRSMKKRGWIFDNTHSICDEPDCLDDVVNHWWEEGKRPRATCTRHAGVHSPPEGGPLKQVPIK